LNTLLSKAELNALVSEASYKSGMAFGKPLPDTKTLEALDMATKIEAEELVKKGENEAERLTDIKEKEMQEAAEKVAEAVESGDVKKEGKTDVVELPKAIGARALGGERRIEYMKTVFKDFFEKYAIIQAKNKYARPLACSARE
jgi:hypothetical protein